MMRLKKKRPSSFWKRFQKKSIGHDGMLAEQHLEAEVDERELELHENITQLRKMEVYDVMVPRADIIAFDIETEASEILKTIRHKTHSRFPVYRDTTDDMVGFVQVKALFDAYHENKHFNLEKLCQKPLFIVPSMRVLDLLLQMRYSKIYLALVVDEYGGINGLVTIEDLVEAILGTVGNDSETSSQNIIAQANGAFLVDGRTELEEFEEKLNITLTLEQSERDEMDTVGGLIFYHAGRVPSRGEVISIEKELELEIMDADPRRVKWVRVAPK